MEKEPPEDDFQFDSIEILGLVIPIILAALAFYLALQHEKSNTIKATPDVQNEAPVNPASSDTS